MTRRRERNLTIALFGVLAACIGWFWLPLLRESYWIDEIGTAFVLKTGIRHPLDQPLYYWLPRLSQAIFGTSEFATRLPSLLCALGTLWFLWRIAGRLIHRNAGWLAIFLFFIPRDLAFEATNARPYSAGIFAATAGMWFLIRWLDSKSRRDAALFIVFAIVLLRLQFMNAPMYLVYGAYALYRGSRPFIVAAVIAIAALPLIPEFLALSRQAASHVVVPMPSIGDIVAGLQLYMLAAALAIAAVASRKFRGRATDFSARLSIGLWWLLPPLVLLAVSWSTGNSIFVRRYYSVSGPGQMLACTAILSSAIPGRYWKPVALAAGVVILFTGVLRRPPTRNSHWREAAAEIRNEPNVLCPSPYVEAAGSAWRPGYPAQSFFYAHLAAYPIHGKAILLPNKPSRESEAWAAAALEKTKPFLIYGGVATVAELQKWATARFPTWTRTAEAFGDVEVIAFDPPTY